MNGAERKLERMPTGIPGLDGILEGGLPEGGVYLVQGTPGAGKTILANQVCFSQVARGGRAVYVTLLAESHHRMLAHLSRFSFFRPEVIPDQLFYAAAFKVVESRGLPGLLTMLRKLIEDHGASVLVIDGMISLKECAQSGLDFKMFLRELLTIAGLFRCTVLLLTNTKEMGHAEQTLVDGILDLSHSLSRLWVRRRIRVSKLRGSKVTEGQHTVEITDDGVIVRPRIESQLAAHVLSATRVAPGEERIDLGIEVLDARLDGGVPSGSMTMVLGPSGVGKTLLGLHFLAAGLKRGQRGAYFGFYERPDALLRKAARIGLPLEDAVERGDLEIVWHAPIEGVIDVLGDRLLNLAREKQLRRLVIDGVHGLQLAGEYPARIHSVFTALSGVLETYGVTTMYSLESREIFGSRLEIPIRGISQVTQNLIVMRYAEWEVELHRVLSVLKIRDGRVAPGILAFRVTESGIVVEDPPAESERLLSGLARIRRSARARRARPGAAP